MHSKKKLFFARRCVTTPKAQKLSKERKEKKRKLQKEKENFPYIGRIIPSKYLRHISWKSNKKQER